MKIKTTITDCYENARKSLKQEKLDKARDEGMGVDDELDDIRIGLWLERFWYFLENNNLLLGQDEEFTLEH